MANTFAGTGSLVARANIRNNNNINAASNNNSTGGSMALPIDNVQADHQMALEETQTFTIKCIPAYRSMLKKFIQWLKDNYPDHYDALVIELSPEQKANTRVYPKSTHDLRYNLLSPDVVKLFICATKINPKNNLHYGFDTLRKYHDAILYCSKLADVPLPPEYKPKMKAFLDTIKKERANHRLYSPGGAGYERCREESTVMHPLVIRYITIRVEYIGMRILGRRYVVHMICSYALCTICTIYLMISSSIFSI